MKVWGVVHALAQDFNKKSVKKINKSDDVWREIFMNGNIISQQTLSVFTTFCSITLQIKNKKLQRHKWYQVMKNSKILRKYLIYFKRNSDICCCFQELTEYRQTKQENKNKQPQFKSQTYGNTWMLTKICENTRKFPGFSRIYKIYDPWDPWNPSYNNRVMHIDI